MIIKLIQHALSLEPRPKEIIFNRSTNTDFEIDIIKNKDYKYLIGANNGKTQRFYDGVPIAIDETIKDKCICYRY